MLIFRKYMVLAAAVAFMALAGMFVEPLHKEQIRKDLIGNPVRGMGPDVVLLTTALGAFRGIAINVIWIRMESLKQDGRFFEIAQLADLACRLAPRFAKVWDFNAWNMAYNISVQIPNHSERWPWVRKGIELLRDQGIPNNPEEPELYFSLAWIYMHKIGDHADEAHFLYKQQFGLKMHEALGGRGTREFLEAAAQAPRRKDTLLLDEELKSFYDRLLQEGFDPLGTGGEGGDMNIFAYLRNPGSVPENAARLMEAERNLALMTEIVRFARAYRLRRRMKLIPEVMLELMDEFGPLDWRNPFSHSIYWATLGRRVATAFRQRALRQRMLAEGMSMEEIIEAGLADADEPREWAYPYRYRDIDYDRIIYGSLQKFVAEGRLLFDSMGRLLPMTGPDYRFTEPMIRQFEQMLAKYDPAERHMVGIRSAYEYFLKRAAIEFYYMGSTADSRRYYEMLREKFPKDSYKIPHEKFVSEELLEYVKVASAPEMRRVVTGLLYQSYFHLGAYADDRAEALYARARRMAQLWMQERIGDDDPTPRQLVDFAAIRESALIDIFSGRVGFPREIITVLRERLPGEAVERIEKAAQEADEEKKLLPYDIDERIDRLLQQNR